MNEQHQTPEPAPQAPQSKKEYQAPEVREYGTLRELTQVSGTGSNMDYGYSGYATTGYD